MDKKKKRRKRRAFTPEFKTEAVRLCGVGDRSIAQRPMTELCREFGISRKTGYKWVGRCNEDGAAALE